MSVSMRDFIKGVFGIYIVTVLVVFSDMFQTGITSRYLDLFKITFFFILTIAIAMFIWFVRD